MAEKSVKYVPVLIPEDAMNEWEKAKTVTINGVTYSIPVGETVDVPDFVAAIVNDWIKQNKEQKEAYKKRMDELKEEFK